MWTDVSNAMAISSRRVSALVPTQYSNWPADRENALGWRDAGKSGPKADCLAHIKEVWTDMRPLSLRQQMEATAKK